MQKLYKSHARPIARIVHGLPTSWEPSIATMKFPNQVSAVAWSPCSRTIAVSWGDHPPVIEILDAMTLMQLFTLEFPMHDLCHGIELVFSPDGRLLTWFSGNQAPDPGWIITWDLQTGVQVSAISPEGWEGLLSSSLIAYSACGTMIGVLNNSGNSTINTYNVLSGTHIFSHLVKGWVSGSIWAYGECLRFATIKPRSVIVWEARFDSAHAPKEIETLSIPDGPHSLKGILPHPTHPQLALTSTERIYIWSTQDSKFLLDSPNLYQMRRISFSPEGHFFVCVVQSVEGDGSEIHLWKENSTGYVLHQRLTSNLDLLRPLISPNGGSIIGSGKQQIQLWPTTESSTSLSTASAQASKRSYNDFIVGFSLGEGLAAIVQLEGETITVLDLNSGVQSMDIHAGMKVYGLGINASSIVAVGYGDSGSRKAVMWNLPIGENIPNLRVDVTNSIQTATFDYGSGKIGEIKTVSVSPNLHHIAIIEKGHGMFLSLYLCDMLTRQYLGPVRVGSDSISWFSPDGCEVWCGRPLGKVDRWKIVEGSEPGISELEHLGSTTYQQVVPPWQSSHGHQVTDNWWILSSSEKHLLWLPPNWRSYGSLWKCRRWSGQFLALLHHELLEVIFLEVE